MMLGFTTCFNLYQTLTNTKIGFETYEKFEKFGKNKIVNAFMKTEVYSAKILVCMKTGM